MTKIVLSLRCADAKQYERIDLLLKHNLELTRKISASALGHDVCVHTGDLVESALILEQENLKKTLATMEERAG